MKDEGPLIPEYLLDYLESATIPELEQIELLRLGRAADVAKHVTASILELVRAEAEALVARVLINRRKVAKLSQPPATTRELIAELIPTQSTAALEEKLRRFEESLPHPTQSTGVLDQLIETHAKFHPRGQTDEPPNGGRNGKKKA